MNKRRLFTRMLQAMAIVMTSAMLIGEVYTFAAYKMREAHSQTVTVDTDYSRYFTGEGTQASPYVINDSNDLRNVSYFTNLGLFDSQTYFTLGQNITYTGDPLTPIGTFHSPFMSQFDGLNHVITNLTVKGTDLADVGMFGFVDASGSIKNFGLVSPVVTAVRLGDAAGSYTYANKDKNPLRAQFTEDAIKNITLTIDTSDPNTLYTKPGASNREGFSKFSISNLPTPTDPLTQVKIRVSDPTYVVPDATGTKFSLSQTYEVSKYVTVEIYAVGVAKIAENGIETNRFGRVTLERFKLFCEHDTGSTSVKNYIVENIDNAKRYKKIMFSGFEETVETVGSKTQYKYHHVDHTLYAGIVVGNLEGLADRIYVSDPILDIQGGPFESNSFIIGRQIDDDNQSKLSKETLNLTALDPNEPFSITTAIWKEQKVPSFWDPNDPPYYKYFKNHYIDNIYADNNTNLFTIAAQDTVKIFTTNDEHLPAADKGKEFVNLVKRKIMAEPGDTVGIDSYALAFSKDGMAKLQLNKQSSRGFPIAATSNGIQMYLTAKNDKSFLVKLLEGNGGKFYLSFEIDYVLLDDAYDANGTFTPTAKLKLFGNNKLATEKRTSVWHYSDPKSYYPDRNANWNDVQYKWYIMDEVGYGTSIGTIDTNVYYESAAILPTEENTNPMLFKASDVSGKTTDSGKIHEVKTKIITIETEILKQGDSTDWLSRFSNSTPYFFLGLDSGFSSTKFEFDLLRLRILMSNAEGNFAGTVLDVDFCEKGDIQNSVTNVKKADNSGYRIETTTFINGDQVSETQGSKPFEVNPMVKNGALTNYRIKVSRTGKTCEVTYSLPGSFSASDPNYDALLPHTVPGFNKFTPTKGTV